MKKYGMGTSVPGMKMTKSAKDANVLRMMADGAANKRAAAMQMMEAGGMTMMNADADIQNDASDASDASATCGTAGKPRCGSKRSRRRKGRRTKRRIRRSRW